ncbi:hypothetical protein BD413DRAFT_113170 [Trametes elegans]|nr:hypothetical protein BD413DRAFT_113170 [Trametes elegans]
MTPAGVPTLLIDCEFAYAALRGRRACRQGEATTSSIDRALRNPGGLSSLSASPRSSYLPFVESWGSDGTGAASADIHRLGLWSALLVAPPLVVTAIRALHSTRTTYLLRLQSEIAPTSPKEVCARTMHTHPSMIKEHHLPCSVRDRNTAALDAYAVRASGETPSGTRSRATKRTAHPEGVVVIS